MSARAVTAVASVSRMVPPSTYSIIYRRVRVCKSVKKKNNRKNSPHPPLIDRRLTTTRIHARPTSMYQSIHRSTAVPTTHQFVDGEHEQV